MIIIGILKKAVLLILLLIVCYNLIYIVNTSLGGKEFRFFNFSIFIVTDKSMSPALNKNDVIITKECKASDLSAGDIIVFDLNGYTTNRQNCNSGCKWIYCKRRQQLLFLSR